MSEDPHDKRTRASIWIMDSDTSIVIDTSTDFRQQALKEKIASIDGLLITHCHADHIHGLDDIRPYTYKNSIPVYGSEESMNELRERFSYIFKHTQRGGGKPQIILNGISDDMFRRGKSIRIGNIEALPIPLKHGQLDVLGYRFKNFAYLTDCNYIPDSSLKKLDGVEHLIIDALRYRPNSTHFTIKEAIEASKRIGAKHTWFTHLCHDVMHKELKQELPDGFAPAFDGLKINI